MPRLRSWADWYHTYPMSPEMVAENIKYAAANCKNIQLGTPEFKQELVLMNFNIQVRDRQSAK